MQKPSRLHLIPLLLVALAILPSQVRGQEEEEARPKKPSPAATTPKAGTPAPGAPLGRKSNVTLKLNQPISLTDEAKNAEHPALKKILEDYSQPHDIIVTQNNTTYKVQPIPTRFDPNGDGNISFVQLNTGAARQTVSRDQIKTFTQFEPQALADVKKLLQSGLDQPGANGVVAVTPFRLVQVAEWVLSDVLRFHTSAKDQKTRTGKGWDGIDNQLKAEIRRLQLAQVRALTSDTDYQNAETLGAHLLNNEKGSREILDVIEKVFLAQADEAIAKKAHFQARERVEYLLRNYNSEVTPGVKRIHDALHDRARDLVAQSDAAYKEKKGNEALVLLDEAERTWPKLDGLVEKRRLIAKEHPTLRIGVRSLPTQMSPTTAESDSDRLAVRLLFDRLIELRGGPAARDGYAYKLGADPQAIVGGWEFILPRDIQWSDGKPFSAKDVLRSFEIVKDPSSPYFDPLARDIVDIRSIDDYRFSVTLKQGHIDPLSLLTFDLLPAHLLLKDRTCRNMAFGKAPVGTGPYIFKGIEGKEAIFAANPNYKRPHAPFGPQIKEIRLVQYGDVQEARQALTNGTLHLVADFSTKEREALTGISRVDLLNPTEPKEPAPPYLTNGRVYWLVPNYRQKHMQNVDLRLAISGAIDREKILNEVFRGGRDKKAHQVLNGPFPLNSWAYNPALTPDKESPYKPDEAKNHAAKAKSTLGGDPPVLTLKYSAGDPTAAQACQQIGTALGTIGVKLKLEAVPFQQLVAELSGDRPNFDLVYWAHDFDNETLNLWPLFDSQGIGPKGRNFMGFERDAAVEGKFREIQQRRDYSFIREKTQMLHDFLTPQKMVLIPLWQLDRHVAVHRNLRPTRLHPVWLVDDIEEWQLEAGK